MNYRQSNMDFILLVTLIGFLLLCLVVSYDIACQYMVHLYDRIGDRLPDNLEIDSAIGLFHVHAHKDECFF